MDNTYSLQGNTEENREYTFYVSENIYNEITKDLENDDRYKTILIN